WGHGGHHRCGRLPGPSPSVVVASGGVPASSQSVVAPAVVSAAALDEQASRKRPVGLYVAIVVLLVIATSAVTALFVQSPGSAPVATAPTDRAATVDTGKAVEPPVAVAPTVAPADVAPTPDAGVGSDAGPAVVARVDRERPPWRPRRPRCARRPTRRSRSGRGRLARHR
ncbi:hypothetical protein ACLEPN_17540, partial [Myxococcus sp. 1LA]